MHLVIAVSGLLLGAWVISMSLRSIVRGGSSRSWPTANGVIKAVTAETKLDSEGDEVSRQDVEYAYRVGGKTYRGTRIRFGLPRMFQWSLPTNFRHKENVDVIHDPARPEISTLQPGFSLFVVFTLAVGCLIFWASIEMFLS